jgi:tRNA U34 5-methylaminomethyl-2-thiouridine-forming methyltransferase MnmC
MSNIEIITTGDGSHSLLNKSLNETYHSHHGAIQESMHVFITNGLLFFLDRSGANEVNIFEVGFGTGLNAFLTLQFALKSTAQIHYTSIEAFPLEKEVWSVLNYASSSSKEYFERLHTCAWNESVSILPNFHLKKILGTVQDLTLPSSFYNLIYFDAFAPNKQPEMWTLSVLKKIEAAMATGSAYVTYCAKGQLKRDLKSLGLTVETLAGPPGKKEMVRALKI